MIVVDIIYNLAILVAVSVLSGFVENRWRRNTRTGQILQGILFGGAALVGMLQPFVFAEGLIFDGRSVVLSLCSLFFGPVAGIIGGTLAAILRISIGGPGAVMGVSVIAESVIIGIFFYYYGRKKRIELTSLNLYIFGIIIHIVMIVLMSTLPSNFRLITLQTIGVTVISFYPLATVLIGRILKDQRDNVKLMEDLSEREEKYRLITENSVDMIWMMNMDLKHTFISPAVFDIYGFTPEEYMNKNIFDMMTEESYFHVMNIFQEEMELEKHEFVDYFRNRIIETEEYAKDGRIISIEARITFVRDQNRKPISIVGVSRDISDRKKAETKLRLSEEKYRFILENHNDLVVKVDAEGRYIFVNPSYCKLFGRTEFELLGKSFLPLVHIDDQESTNHEMKQLDSPPYTCYVEQRALTIHGWRWLAWSDKAILGKDGKIESIIGVGRDITDNKTAEQALRESESRFKTIVENIPFQFWTIDKNGIFTYQNKTSIDFFGKQLGKKLDDVVLNLQIRERWKDEVNSVLSGDTIHGIDNFSKNGKSYTFDKIITPIITGFEISGAIGISVDISDRIALLETEEKYKRLIDNIGHDYFLYQEDTNHQLVYVSPSVLKVLGYYPEELIDKPNYGGIVTENPSNEILESNTSSGYEGNKKPPYVLEVFHKDGTRRWLEVAETPVLDFDGKVIALDGIAKDITDNHRIEEAISKQVLALTRPLDSTEDISFTDLFNLDEIQKIQDAFSDATNVAALITYPDGTPITRPSNFCKLCNDIIRKSEKGLANCYLSDSIIGRSNSDGPTIQPCLSGGLWDAGASIVVGGKHVANWLIGQVISKEADFDELVKYADVIDVDKSAFKTALNDVPVMSKEQFESISKMLFTIATELSLKAYQNIQQARFIADLNRAKEIAEQRERTFQTIFQTNTVLMAVSSINDRVFLDVNSAFLEVFEYEKDELIGRNAVNLGLWENLDDRDRIVEQVLETNQVKNFETRMLSKSGIIHDVLYSASTVTINNEKCLLSVMADITERKRVEEKILNLNNELELMVKKRTEELNIALYQLQDSNIELQLLNSQLQDDAEKIIHLNAELNDALASKDKFFSIIAHDLKNPFVALLNNSDLLLNHFDKIDEAKKKNMILRMKEASQVTYSLLENLLQWSRSQMGKIAPKPHFANILELVNKTIQILNSQAVTKDISIQVCMKEDTYSYCDSEMVLTILRNLVSNAIKFSDANGKIEIGLSDMVIFSSTDNKTSFAEPNGSTGKKPLAVYYVKDYGAGISAVNLNKLFRIDENLATVGTIGEKGTGLGLIICKEFIEIMGGEIWAESEEGKGSTFFFALPMN